MKDIIDDYDFITILEGKCGTHIIRKMAIARSRRCGCSKDETDTRARWKQIRPQYSYADTILPWPDAKVAADIFKGGPIHNQVRVATGISEDWILSFVVPSIHSKYCRSVSLVHGRALPWRTFDEVQHFSLPENIFRRVNNAYQDLRDRYRLPEGETQWKRSHVLLLNHMRRFILISCLKMSAWKMMGIILVEKVVVSCIHVKLIARN